MSTASLAYARARPMRPIAFSDVASFLIPCLLFAELDGIGRLFFAEIALLGLLPFLLVRARPAGLPPVPATFVLLCLLWLWAQVTTDIFRMTPPDDFLRGWSKIAVTLANFVALYLLLENRPRRLMLFGAGLAAGLALDFVLSPSAYAAGDPWKFGIGFPLTLALVLVATRVTSRPWLPPVILLFAAALNLERGYRSLSGTCFLAAVCVALYAIVGRRSLTERPLRRAPVLGLALIGVVSTVLFVDLYADLAQRGSLGAAAQLKYQRQGSSGLGIFLDGRVELRAAARAIKDSPLIGHGSWAKDPRYYQSLLDDYARLGTAPSVLLRNTGLIPTHSHLLGAWVEAGVAGIAVWLWVLWLVGCALANGAAAGRLAPLVAFTGTALAWDVLFSPFGAERRMLTPFYVIVLLAAVHSSKRAERP